MTGNEREFILEEETIILRNSGEIPEIALYSSLFYLEEDDEGPGLRLDEEELHLLQDAALARAQEIVLRDLDPDNRDLGMYRGPARSITNWTRLHKYLGRIGRQCDREFRKEVCRALIAFLERECDDVRQQKRDSSVNCSAAEIRGFCRELGLDMGVLPPAWPGLCID